MEIGQTMLPRHSKADDLAFGMDSPIRPASANHSRLRPRNCLYCPFDLSLNRTLLLLDLKAVEICTIVLDPGPEPHGFGHQS
jgi:hypothetical protein